MSLCPPNFYCFARFRCQSRQCRQDRNRKYITREKNWVHITWFGLEDWRKKPSYAHAVCLSRERSGIDMGRQFVMLSSFRSISLSTSKRFASKISSISLHFKINHNFFLGFVLFWVDVRNTRLHKPECARNILMNYATHWIKCMFMRASVVCGFWLYSALALNDKAIIRD